MPPKTEIELQVTDGASSPRARTNGLVLTVTGLLAPVAGACMDADECIESVGNLLRTNFQAVRGPIEEPLRYRWFYDETDKTWLFYCERQTLFQLKQGDQAAQVFLITREINPRAPRPGVGPPITNPETLG